MRNTEVGSPAVAPAGCSAITGESALGMSEHDEVISQGSVMYELAVTSTGFAGSVKM